MVVQRPDSGRPVAEPEDPKLSLLAWMQLVRRAEERLGLVDH